MSQNTPLFARTFDLPLGNLTISPAYWQVVAILILLFLLIFSLARLRHMYVKWSFKGFFPTLILGFVLALVLEGFLIIAGKTLLTEIIGIEKAPKPISTFLDESRNKLRVVIDEEPVCKPVEVEKSIKTVVEIYNDLSDSQKETVKSVVCE